MKFLKKKISGWGNYPIIETKIKNISSLKDYSDFIKTNNPHISRGLGRSYADQAVLKKGYTLQNRMSRILSFDSQNGILIAESGISLGEIIEIFTPQGWFPKIVPGTKFVTLGGAIANDIHGKAHHTDGTFVNSVIEFTMITPFGERIICSRDENTEIFYASFGGLGLLGWIENVTIQLKKVESSFFVSKAVQVNDLSEMLEAFDKYDKEYRYSVAWFDPLSKGEKIGKGVLSLGNIAERQDLNDQNISDPLQIHSKNKINLPVYLPDFTLNTFTGSILNKVIGYTQANAPLIIHYDKFFFPLDAVGNWNRGYGTRGFLQYQFVIPFGDEYEVLKEILGLIAKSGCTPFLNVLKKMGKESQYLSFPFEGYTVAIDFPISKNLFDLIDKLDNLVIEAKGRIYLGKDAVLNETKFRFMYPNCDEWIKIKQELDPEKLLQNEIAKRIGLLNY
ncbi:FAD-binding oxidoreductase [Marinigracilibium pacificum]|uniref:FAD-binding oxidoreductase n=1 Tax=Marinigracilibium pacificum TaxID=2729599 RepID=A0A848J1P4_9BACT|nr:FAD-binding oxidoreductase [Marinigracilibium pacificum]